MYMIITITSIWMKIDIYMYNVMGGYNIHMYMYFEGSSNSNVSEGSTVLQCSADQLSVHKRG